MDIRYIKFYLIDVNKFSWRNFVILRSSDLYGVSKQSDHEMKAMYASSWVWNLMKNLERRKI